MIALLCALGFGLGRAAGAPALVMPPVVGILVELTSNLEDGVRTWVALVLTAFSLASVLAGAFVRKRASAEQG